MATSSTAEDYEILNTDELTVEQCDVASDCGTTPGVFLCDKFAGALDRKTVAAIREKQTEMLHKMEISQMKLSNCLSLSDYKYDHAAQVFKSHTKRLVSMKQDVESIHKRIRVLKAKLAKEYPDVVAENESKFAVRVRDDDDDSDSDNDRDHKHSHDS